MRRGRFADALLGSSALVERRDEVDIGWIDEDRQGLGTDRVLVQLSASLPEWELAGWTEEHRRDVDHDEQIFGGTSF